MSNQVPQQDLIDRYLRGKMSPAERVEFEAKIEQEESLAAEVDSLRPAYQLMQAAGQISLKEQLSALEQEITAEESVEASRSLFRSPVAWAVAAALLVLALTIGWWWQQGPADPTELYAEYFEPYEAPINLRAGGTQDHWQQAVQAYETGDFVTAAEQFALSDTTEEHPVFLLDLYQGLSWLNQAPPQTAKAVPLLERVLKTPNLYQEVARWYLALAALQQGEAEGGKQWLNQIESDRYKSAERARLLSQLP